MRFVTDDFLLTTQTARRLYHQCASQLPIIDYHCHISARDIAQNVSFDNLTHIWLSDDHYKWTAMRWCGVDERLITGDASDEEKLTAYAACMEDLVGNPLLHWSHLELKTYFGFDGVLSAKTAHEVYEMANARLATLRARDFMRMAHVRLICTTDDPADDLIWHEALEKEGFEIRVLPAFRPDKALAVASDEYADYLARLSQAAGVPVEDLPSLCEALRRRLCVFAQHGCVLSDHGLTHVSFLPCDGAQADAILKKRLSGGRVTKQEAAMFQSHMLVWLGREYARRNWAMQLHFGVLRDVNPTLMRTLGVDAGGDCIGSASDIEGLTLLMRTLEEEGSLPRMILYSINPADNAALSVLAGCFQSGEARGKIQHGSAWWFNDTKLGMENHLRTLASVGALGNFVGMLTDSRSFLSYARHDYFRRILCSYLGEEAESGAYPQDEEMLMRLVRKICYQNTADYFGFQLGGE